MLLRSLALALLFAILLGAQKIPPAVFTGKVHGSSKKEITLETEEGNLVDFYITRKTRVMRGKTPIPLTDIDSGEEVTIEARQDMGQFLTALTITAKPPEKN